MARNKLTFSTLLPAVLGLFTILFVLVAYTFLHEGGHALAGVLFGQRLTGFDVNFLTLDTHVGLIGGDMEPWEQAVQSASGALLPLIVWAVFISLAPRRGSFLMEILKLAASMVAINTLLPWIILPVLALFNRAPVDDVTNFLRYSHIHPLLLAVLALALYAGGWALFLKRINGLRNQFLLFRAPSRESLVSGLRRTFPVMAGCMAACVLATFAIQSAATRNASVKFTPPQDFSLVREIDLSKDTYTSAPIWQFTLAQPGYTGIFIDIMKIRTTYIDMGIAGPDGFRSTLLHGEGYTAERDGGLWEKNLPAGTYQIELTSRAGTQGVLSIYLNIP